MVTEIFSELLDFNFCSYLEYKILLIHFISFGAINCQFVVSCILQKLHLTGASVARGASLGMESSPCVRVTSEGYLWQGREDKQDYTR